MTAMNYSDAAVPEEPIDAQFEPAPDPLPGPDAGPGPGWRALVMASLMAALAGAAGGAVAARLIPAAPEGAPRIAAEEPARLQEMEAALVALETDLARLESRMSQRQGGSGNLQALEALEERIGRLERSDRNAAMAGDPSPALMAAIDSRLQALEASAARPTPPPMADPAVNEAAARRADAALALSAIEAAARRGSGFEADYRILRQAGPSDGPIRRLAPFTEGVATLADLHASFPAVRDDVIRAARPQEPAPAGGGLSWIDRIMGDAVTVRPADEVPEPVEVHLAEAGAALAAGDLAASLQAMGRLDNPLVSSAQDWIEEANRRLALEAVLEDIRKSLIESEN